MFSDRELMQRSQAGSMDAYAQLFERHSEKIKGLAIKLLKDKPGGEDISQETFTRGLASINTWRGDADPKTWFMSIAVNLCRNRFRRNRERSTEDQHLDIPVSLAPHTDMQRTEVGVAMIKAILQLHPTHLCVFMMRRDGTPFEEIASFMKAKVGTVRCMQSRAKAELRRILGEEFNFAMD